MTDRDVRVEIVEPSAPLDPFVQVFLDGESVALIPWEEAEAIAEAVERHRAEVSP